MSWMALELRSILALLLLVAGSCAPQAALAADADTERRILLMLAAPLRHYRPDINYGGGYESSESRRRLARILAESHGLRLVGDWPMPALRVDCFVLEAPSMEAREASLPLLAADPRVESVQAVQAFHALANFAEDPLAIAQPAVVQWRLPELHRLATGRRVVIAMVDSGVEAAHPDLRGQRITSRNFLDGQRFEAEAHGTAVAGIIAARSNNGVGIMGVAPDARLLALRACAQPVAWQPAQCDTFSLAKALQFALDSQAEVINLSLTGPDDALLARLLDVAIRRGAIVVGAADPARGGGGFPANHRGVLRVAGRPGPGVLLAPDRAIPAPVPGGGWGMVNGSSFAAAQVTGLMALVRELTPTASSSILNTPFSPAPTVGFPSRRPQYLDACGIIARAAQRCVCDCQGSL